jgi:hypothetical protein
MVVKKVKRGFHTQRQPNYMSEIPPLYGYVITRCRRTIMPDANESEGMESGRCEVLSSFGGSKWSDPRLGWKSLKNLRSMDRRRHLTNAKNLRTDESLPYMFPTMEDAYIYLNTIKPLPYRKHDRHFKYNVSEWSGETFGKYERDIGMILPPIMLPTSKPKVLPKKLGLAPRRLLSESEVKKLSYPLKPTSTVEVIDLGRKKKRVKPKTKRCKCK